MDLGEVIPPLYEEAKKVRLNLDDGYALNVVTGDSIKPIINSHGYEKTTGVSIPVIGKVIDPDSVELPKEIIIKELDIVPAQINLNITTQKKEAIPVNNGSLSSIVLNKDSSSFILINSGQDTIPSGRPIMIKGQLVQLKPPAPIIAKPSRFKDASITNLRYLDNDQGLASSSVFCSFQDSRGWLWFGTLYGASMYNGESFINYKVEHGLSHDWITSILEDNEGNIWLGSFGGGVSVFNGKSFIHYQEKQGLSSNVIWCMYKDSRGKIWLGTDDSGVMLFDGQSFTYYTMKEGLSSNTIRSITEDSNGNIWFGTKGGGANQFDGHSFTHYGKNEGLNSDNILSIFEDSNRNIWFGTAESGANLFDGNSITHFSEIQGLGNNTIFSISEDDHGGIWFSTFGGGISVYDGQSFTLYTEKQGLSGNLTKSILKDERGDMWISTWGGGVSQYNSKPFMHYTEEQGLSSKKILTILEDKSGNIWYGTWGSGISLYDGESFTHFTAQKELSDNIITSIIEDKKGNIWVGTYKGGVNLYKGDSFIHYTTDQGMSSNVIRCMLEDSNGNIWFGTEKNGVSMYNGEFFTHFTEDQGMASNYIVSILEDSEGNIWFGTKGAGAMKYDGHSIINYTEKQGLSNNVISSMLEDRLGNIWFGTDYGICRFDGNLFVNYSEKQGLSHNEIRSILEDENDNIWVTTTNGLNLLEFQEGKGSGNEIGSVHLNAIESKENLEIQAQIFTYGIRDGLKGLEFNFNSAYMDSKNCLWWGSDKSLTMLKMNDFKIPTESPTVRLNRIDINEKFYYFQNLDQKENLGFFFDKVEGFNNYPNNLKLDYDKNHLTFHFSAVDFHSPHKVQYSYKMEGLNDYWSVPSKNVTADYRNLPYGTFTLKISAIGESQSWGEPFEFKFKILPPWWHTWWAYLCFTIIAFMSVIGFVRLRTTYLNSKRKMLKRLVQKSTQELKEKNEQIRQQSKKLHVYNNKLNAQNENLEKTVAERTNELLEKNKKLSDYAFMNAHNVSAPVANIKGIIKVLSLDIALEEKLDFMEKLEMQVDLLDEVLYSIRDRLEKDDLLVKQKKTPF